MHLKVASAKWRPSCFGLNTKWLFSLPQLSSELGKRPPGKDKHEPGAATLMASTWPALRAK